MRDEPGDVEKVWKDLKDCFIEEAVDVFGETRGIARQKETRPLARIEKLGVHFTEGVASQSARFRPRRSAHHRHMQNVHTTKSVVMGKTSLFII